MIWAGPFVENGLPGRRALSSGGAPAGYAGPVTTSAADAPPTAPAPIPALLRDPALVATTFVVLDFEGTTPRGYSPEPIEVAAVALRRDGDRWQCTWSFEALMKPPTHAPVTGFDVAQTGITSAMLADSPGA